MFNLKRHKTAQQNDLEEIGNLAHATDITNFQSDLSDSVDQTKSSIDGNLAPEDAATQYTDEEKQEMFDDVQFFAYAKMVYDNFGDRPELNDLLAQRATPNPTESDLNRINEIITTIRNKSISPEEQEQINTVSAQTVAASMFAKDKPLLLSTLNQMAAANRARRAAKSRRIIRTAQMPDPMTAPMEDPMAAPSPDPMAAPEGGLFPILPVDDIGDFISKGVQIILSSDEKSFNEMQNELLPLIDGLEGQEPRSIFDTLREYMGNVEEEEEIGRILIEVYKMLPDTQPNSQEATEPVEGPTMAKSFNLSKHMSKTQSGLQKVAYTNLGDAYILYGPTEKRICPKLAGKTGGKVGAGGVVSEEICRFHCLDGIIIDDNKTICGEAVFRAHQMDKFSREYVDADGNIVGGYLNKRFEINRNVPEENKMRLKPGETRKPRPPEWGSTESRMQAMRKSEGEKRGYRPSTNTGDPFNWQTDVDQNNVNQSQATRDSREEASGHQLVQYTNKDKQENNPKIAKTASTDEGNEVGKWDGGWLKGEWKCPKCGTIIGKNLKSESPHGLVKQHQDKCQGKKSFNLKKHKTASLGEEPPFQDKTAQLNDWDKNKQRILTDLESNPSPASENLFGKTYYQARRMLRLLVNSGKDLNEAASETIRALQQQHPDEDVQQAVSDALEDFTDLDPQARELSTVNPIVSAAKTAQSPSFEQEQYDFTSGVEKWRSASKEELWGALKDLKETIKIQEQSHKDGGHVPKLGYYWDEYHTVVGEINRRKEAKPMLAQEMGTAVVNASSKYPKSETEPYNPWAVCKSKKLSDEKEERCIHHVKDKNKEKKKKSFNLKDHKTATADYKKKSTKQSSITKVASDWNFGWSGYESLIQALDKRIRTDQVFRDKLEASLGFNNLRDQEALLDAAVEQAERINKVSDTEAETLEVWITKDGGLTVNIPGDMAFASKIASDIDDDTKLQSCGHCGSNDPKHRNVSVFKKNQEGQWYCSNCQNTESPQDRPPVVPPFLRSLPYGDDRETGDGVNIIAKYWPTLKTSEKSIIAKKIHDKDKLKKYLEKVEKQKDVEDSARALALDD